MTHDELVVRAGRWLRSRRHTVVLHEIGSDGRECPDVIGWMYRGRCTLIECKTSRADFKKDGKKRFRHQGGMAACRWYATPPNLVTVEELPPRWGLVEVGLRCRVVRHPMPFANNERNIAGETACLISAVQRATDGWGRKVFGEISPVHGQLDPHPTVGATIKMLRDENTKLRRRLRLEAESWGALA